MLVVAILAVMGLFSLTLTHNTRVELMASRNWADGVQARLAAASDPALALAAGPASLQSASSGVGLASQSASSADALQPVSLRMMAAPEPRAQYLRAVQVQALAEASQNPDDREPIQVRYYNSTDALAELEVIDASGKININAILPQVFAGSQKSESRLAQGDADAAVQPPSEWITELALARFIQTVLSAHGVISVNPNQLAREIVMRPLGPDQRPGRAGYDDNGNQSRSDLAVDGIDNDLNGRVDDPRERRFSMAKDGLDNNRDGQIDEAGESVRNDGLDNNRNGSVDEPGEGIDEPEEFVSDPRLPPRGDDRPYTSLRELMSLKSMTPEAYDALTPYLTVLSSSYAAFDLEGTQSTATDAMGYPQVDPNTATPDQLYEVLSHRYPHASPKLLGQFVVNMVDRRDQDDLPTVWKHGGKTWRGMERTPYINEVCPDTASLDEEGDDGQFIELHNPYGEVIDLAGWRLEGAGMAISLTGSLPSGGYLVFTDDFNNEEDPTPEYGPGIGSFYAIFGRAPTGHQRRLVELSELDLPNGAGSLKLYNADGDLVDQFDYTEGQWTGAASSLQRRDPRMTDYTRVSATPLAANPGQEPNGAISKAIAEQEKWQNRPFASALDVMLVSSGVGSQDARSSNRPRKGTPNDGSSFGMPVLSSEDGTQLDIRLIDCFRVGTRIIADELESESTVNLATGPGTRQTERGTSRRTNSPVCDVAYGRLNLNTAPPIILNSLEGMDASLLGRIVRSREGRAQGGSGLIQPSDPEALKRPLNPLARPAWRNLSEFMLDEEVWQDQPLYARLDRAYPFINRLACHTLVIETEAENRPGGDNQLTSSGEPRRQSRMRATRMLSADRGGVETVSFQYQGRGNVGLGDPDLRYSYPSTDPEYRLPMMRRVVEYRLRELAEGRLDPAGLTGAGADPRTLTGTRLESTAP